MKRELVYSLIAFFAGIFIIIIAPTLSYYFKSAGLPLTAPMEAVERGGYVTTEFLPALPAILSMILISFLIAGTCAFIVKKQST